MFNDPSCTSVKEDNAFVAGGNRLDIHWDNPLSYCNTDPSEGTLTVKSTSCKSLSTKLFTCVCRLDMFVFCVICSLYITAMSPSFCNTLDLVVLYSPSDVNWIQELTPACVHHRCPILLLGGSSMLAPAIHSLPSNLSTLPTVGGTTRLTSTNESSVSVLISVCRSMISVVSASLIQLPVVSPLFQYHT